MSKIEILVCIHKESYVRNDSIYIPIHVGKSISDIDLPYQSDDEGDNISRKNENYAEVTALYWAWKNLKGVDIIGLNHYRRYFDFASSKLLPQKTIKYTTKKKYLKKRIKDQEEIESALKNADIIIGKPVKFTYNIYVHYCVCHKREDFLLSRDIIHELTPEYDDAFTRVMNRRRLFSCNMFVCRWELFDDYCKWLFQILFALEERIDTSSYANDQKRVCGFLAERLFNVYIEKHKLKLKKYPIIQINDI